MSDIITEQFKCPDGMPVYLAQPRQPGRYPVVVLMHERYGLVRHTQDLARRCAVDGFVVCAPNFFFRHPDQAVLTAGNSRYDMTDPESVTSLNLLLASLGDHPSADMSKIAVAGFCQTGRHPLIFAAERPIQAAVVWYGAAPAREWQVTQIQPEPLDKIIAALPCPVFGAFGSDDHLISITDVCRFRNALEQHNRSYEIHLYAGAPHGWLNDTMPGRYRKPQADAAWSAQQRFLREVFAGEWPSQQVRWRFESEYGRDYDFTKNRRQE
jgi:carboxymethylenebutenolidase